MIYAEKRESVIFAYKPAGITSAGFINLFKKKLKELYQAKLKVGHTGTLDKFAEGLLILLIGQATSFSEYFLKKDKTYIVEFLIGKQTDTLDPEGKILEEWNLERIKDFLQSHREKIVNAVLGLTKLKEQIPPDYSAIKIQGIRSSDWVRKGVKVDLPPRKIEIYKSEILEFHPDGIIKVELHVSSGSYVRAIARDLGSQIQVPIMVRSLIRTKIGNWSIYDSILTKDMSKIQFFSLLEVLRDWDQIVVPIELEKRILHGKKIRLDLSQVKQENFLLLNEKKEILAWGKKIHSKEYIYKKVFTR
ncbi:MAG: tRNA pseudouridine(55) synthase TruB [Leptospiraceae bacterium]|nr:tRNA pseudouridine(55) synthase TruB [Leptospiraceae bacterium]MDW7976859.1 tRNA pseudouridine(55) synthase TruB [Leptospiraceae bacterium]